MKKINWLFVLVDKGKPTQRWLIKIRSIQQLIAYYNEISDAKQQKSDLDIQKHNKKNDKKIDVQQASQHTNDNSLDEQMKALATNQQLYIDSDGKWTTEPQTEDNFLYRKYPAFPNFTKKDISIKSFNDGVHSYARIGDLEVREGDKIKWDTYEEAYEACMKIIGQNGDEDND